jgi:hypothetical protein
MVFNAGIDTDFPGHVQLDGTTLVVRIPIHFSVVADASAEAELVRLIFRRFLDLGSALY